MIARAKLMITKDAVQDSPSETTTAEQNRVAGKAIWDRLETGVNQAQDIRMNVSFSEVVKAFFSETPSPSDTEQTCRKKDASISRR
jgi:hypothetical protein